MDCKKKTNKTACPCSYKSCSKKGLCCACIAYHRKKGEAPGCLFPPEVEKTYDRRLETLARCYGK